MLPLDPAPASSFFLYNYDVDRDDRPGLYIQKGGSGAVETDVTKGQAWRTPATPVSVQISGIVTVEIWSAMKDFQPGKRGSVTVYLRDFDGAGYGAIAQQTLTYLDWQGANKYWTLKTFALGVGSYVLAPGHSLELKLVVEEDSDDDMWFAYDTAWAPSRIKINN